MKVRWREHGIILMTLLVIATITGFAWDSYLITPEQIETSYGHFFNNQDIPFNYSSNILLPRIFFIVLLYICYLWVNLLIVPFAKKTAVTGKAGKSLFRFAWIIFQFFLIGYIIALGANIATYYARPYYYNYTSFGFVALFGYNDQPLSNLFAGFDRAIIFLTVYATYIFFREGIINYLERPGTSRGYRVLITNQVTIAMVVFICIPVIFLNLNLVSGGIIF